MLHNVLLRHAFNPLHEVQRFAHFVAAWHTENDATIDPADTALGLHRSNFDLWHLEDLARDPVATDASIAAVKRAIDRTNQQRNDLAEQVDVALLQQLSAAGLPRPGAPLHSETPGMILDRLSILALKAYHTREQAEREDASPDHRQRNLERLEILQAQTSDLSACLVALWDEVCHGSRAFKRYRQLKMYNDPALNPAVYGASTPLPRQDY